MHYIYILECKDGTYYTGYTNDLDKRINAHNRGEGAKYTRGRGPVKCLYTEEFNNKIDAMKREYEIKRLTRQQKQKLIEDNKKGR